MGPDQPDPLTALIADARSSGRPTPVPLAGHLFHVRPAWSWPWVAVTHLLNGHYHRWAALAVEEDRAFRRVDPTNRQVRAFLNEWGQSGGDSPADIIRLAPILTRHTRAFEGDLALRGVDVRDLFRPDGGATRLTWRHLAAVWEALPGECLTKTALRDELGDEKLAEMGAADRKGHGAWSHEALLLAAVVDSVRNLTWRFVQVNFKDGRTASPPEPLPRPGVVPKRRPQRTQQSVELLRYMAANGGALPPGWVNSDRPANVRG